ncbi:hypothetical protein ABLE92_17740 [Gordonia sp. VNQ95]|uniref:hypothetical protein n=1 Tax=Gordonia sp. VNQ95 TaxID=3156619 RepID=UPI0032B45069
MAQHQFSYAILPAQGEVTDAGAELTTALVNAQKALHYKRFPAASGSHARLRPLSMLQGSLVSAGWGIWGSRSRCRGQSGPHGYETR